MSNFREANHLLIIILRPKPGEARRRRRSKAQTILFFSDIEDPLSFRLYVRVLVDHCIINPNAPHRVVNGLENFNCLRAYFAFQGLLNQKEDFYQSKYSFVPFFKAGLNVGQVTIAEVGEIKREIAFHGDTLNTAARIQDMCNEVGKELLISEHLAEKFGEHTDFKTDLIGNVLLRGKKNKLNVYSVTSQNV